MSSGLDWAGLMSAGLHDLRLRPDEFWALTPAELALMLGQTKGSAPMNRSQLEALQAAYPDNASPGMASSDINKGTQHE